MENGEWIMDNEKQKMKKKIEGYQNDIKSSKKQKNKWKPKISNKK